MAELVDVEQVAADCEMLAKECEDHRSYNGFAHATDFYAKTLRSASTALRANIVHPEGVDRDKLHENIMDILGSRYEGTESYDDSVAGEILALLSTSGSTSDAVAGDERAP